jgi:hypothetical protein
MMEKIRDKDINVTYHAVDGFTLSYTTDKGDYYHKQYTGYGIREAKRNFREYIHEKDSKIFRRMTRDDVLVSALSCVCGGNLSAARELLGNS